LGAAAVRDNARAGDVGYRELRTALFEPRSDLPASALLCTQLIELIEERKEPQPSVVVGRLIELVVRYETRDGARADRGDEAHDRTAGLVLAAVGEILARVGVLAVWRMAEPRAVTGNDDGDGIPVVDWLILVGEHPPEIESHRLPSGAPRPVVGCVYLLG